MATPTASSTPALAARGLSKAFGGTLALDGVTFALHEGEIHALVGENGAGKSTLTKLLSGVHQPDRGHVELDGRRIALGDPAAARREGIAVIYQEPSLFPHLSVAENMFVNHQPLKRFGCVIDRKRRREAARVRLATLGLMIDPRRRVDRLSVAELQMIEVAGALSRDVRILLVDEPTASLTPAEVSELFRVLRDLRSRGVAICFIGHRLEEVFAIADRITVLRDGRVVASDRADRFTRAGVVKTMVGRDVAETRPSGARRTGDVMLAVDGLCRGDVFADVSFELRAGEILGMAGLVGAGRSEIAHAIFGIDRLDAGSVRIGGAAVDIRHPHDAMRHGIAYLPEDRRTQGLAIDHSITANISLTLLREVSSRGFVVRGRERAIATDWRRRLDIRARSINQDVADLSGGNQQKVVLAKWLARAPRVLILDEPTRGVDVGAKVQIHASIAALAEQGIAIMLISSDLPEVLALSDRVAVVRDGTVVATLSGGDAVPERVMAAATGTTDDVVAAEAAS